MHTITADLDAHGTNAALHDNSTSCWRDLDPTRRAILAARFPGVPDNTLAQLANSDAGIAFAPDVGPHGPARVQRTPTGAWRQAPGTDQDRIEYFNEEVSTDWLCLRSETHADAADSTSPVFSTRVHDLSGTAVVKDALILIDRATRVSMAVLVSSHAEYAACVERWIHHHGVMRTLASDGEPANRGPDLQALRREYGIPFTKYNAPYHPHHNGRVESFIALLKRRTARICEAAHLDPVTHWPDALLHAIDVLNVTPRRSLGGISPLERLHGKAPCLKFFRRFWCEAYILPLGSYKLRGILASNYIKCAYIGTGLRKQQTGALFLLPDGRRIVTVHFRVRESADATLPTQAAPTPTARVLPASAGPAQPVVLARVVLHADAPRASRSPREVRHALAHAAKMREMDNLWRIGTFKPHLGALPADARTVPGIFVMKMTAGGELKLDKDGGAKARFCARGDLTVKSADMLVFSPCITWTSYLLFISMVAAHRGHILQADVVNAYVQADLHAHPSTPPTFIPLNKEMREIFGDRVPRDARYLRVHRALYGLRESAKLFHDHFDRILRKNGFALLGNEPCLYIKRCSGGGFLLLALHVDDFLHACCSASIEEFLSTHESIKRDLNGLLKTNDPDIFLGTAVSLGGSAMRSDGGADIARAADGGIHVNCSAQILSATARLLPADDDRSLTDTRVPMSPAHFAAMNRRMPPADADCADEADAAWYRTTIGLILWIQSRCRPDVAFAAHYLARSMARPTKVHLAAATHLLRYLRGTHSLGLLFHPDAVARPGGVPREVVVFHDSTFAGDREDSSSVVGIAAFILGTCFYWKVIKVAFIARSSTDAELQGADSALRFVEDHIELLDAMAEVSPEVMGRIIPPCIPSYTDNKGLHDLVSGVNDNADSGKRHIRTRIDHLRSAVKASIISVRWAPGREMHADILTKCSNVPTFLPQREHLVVETPV